MKYGYFDESKKEYVITRPDTPAPWVNYLGSPEYGAIVSNNAGGYSFAKSGANGRLLRYVFNQFDEPGRYIYIRDNESKDYWSASWQPVGKDLNEYKSECHHGTAYTKMMADYSGIHSEVRYYVPLNKTYEVWNLSVTNNSDKARSLNITGYAEFTNNSNYEQDQVNLQYSQYITKTVFVENRVRQMIHANLDRIEDGKEIDNKDVVNRFIGLAVAPVDSWCGDRGEFLGEYHRYGNPVGVESGKLNNHGNYNENSCGAITTVLELAPGETKTLAFILGRHKESVADEIIASYEDVSVCDKEIEELKKEGMWFVCADMGGTTMYDLDLKGSIGLVIGNEGKGVSRLVKEKCDFVASIPMFGDIDSLNASVATGVLAYEIVRQRMGK